MAFLSKKIECCKIYRMYYCNINYKLTKVSKVRDTYSKKYIDSNKKHIDSNKNI